jgi:hypothetical protein
MWVCQKSVCAVPSVGVTDEGWIGKDFEGKGPSLIGVLSVQLPADTSEDHDEPRSWRLLSQQEWNSCYSEMPLWCSPLSVSVSCGGGPGVSIHLQVLYSFPKFVQYYPEGGSYHSITVFLRPWRAIETRKQLDSSQCLNFQSSSVSTMTKLRVERPRNWCSIPDRSKNGSQRPDRLWGPLHLLSNEYRELFLQG